MGANYAHRDTHHRQVPLPLGAASPLALGARSLEGVAPALGAVERHVAVAPGHAASEAAGHLKAQFFDGQDVVGVDLGAPGGLGDVVETVAEGRQRAAISNALYKPGPEWVS